MASGGENRFVTFDVDYKVTEATNSGSLDSDWGPCRSRRASPLGSDDQLGARSRHAGRPGRLDRAERRGRRYQITGGDPLPGLVARVLVRMNVDALGAPTVDESRFSCATWGSALGVRPLQRVIAASDRDSDGSNNNKVCGPVRVRTVIIAKAGRQFTNLQWPEIANEYIDAQGYSTTALAPSSRSTTWTRASTGRAATTLDASNNGDFPYWKVTTLAADRVLAGRAKAPTATTPTPANRLHPERAAGRRHGRTSAPTPVFMTRASGRRPPSGLQLRLQRPDVGRAGHDHRRQVHGRPRSWSPTRPRPCPRPGLYPC